MIAVSVRQSVRYAVQLGFTVQQRLNGLGSRLG